MAFSDIINQSIENILRGALSGAFPIRLNTSESNLVSDGVSIFLGDNKITSAKPLTRNHVALSPVATILIKKKAFSTLSSNNDLQWLDRTEVMLLRSTKALFAYKVAQIRAYESLTKFENFFRDYQEINLKLFIDLLQSAQFLTVPDTTTGQGLNLLISAISNSLSNLAYDELKEDILKILKRNAFSNDVDLTTWIVDPDSTDNYSTGPGTGVIELCCFTNLKAGSSIETTPYNASFNLEDPYRIMTVSDDDIEIAIQEALLGTVGILNELANGGLGSTKIDYKAVVAAGFELAGLGALDGTINIHYIRNQLRIFYLGKGLANCGDGVHMYIRGNKTTQDFSLDSSFVSSELEIDETILEAERILFTNKRIDFQTYKKLRTLGDSSLAMKHVFGGYITRVQESFSGVKWVTDVSCVDNMGWLLWSRFMINPAPNDPQGLLEDPLTPYELKIDASGSVDSAGGPQLIEENKYLLKTGLLAFDSGILNGQIATEGNLLQGQYNDRSGSLGGVKILQHPHGFVYRWKTGIIAATAEINVIDPLNEKDVTIKTHNQAYGYTVVPDVLTNLDIANIISLLVVGQPYNIESFIRQAYEAHNIGRQSSISSVSATDPLAAVFDVVRRQNTRFGNFRPYRMITMSNATIEQTAGSNVQRTSANTNIQKLQEKRSKIDSLIKKLQVNPSGNAILIRTLISERISIDSGIKRQVELVMSNSNSINSNNAISSNFNLFGQNRVLPLTGNFQADHEVTRAMMVVGAKRRIEDVRLNRDQNLLIISDQYDENTELRAYLFAMRDKAYPKFNGEAVDVFKKCSEAAGFANLEFFCNPEGHLELRPPQWNRTPLSVLQSLFEISQTTNRKIVPEFLRDMFETRMASLKRQIHELNIRLVILSLLLDKYPDSSLLPNFPSTNSVGFVPSGLPSGKASLRFFGVRTSDEVNDTLELRTQNKSFGLGKILNTGTSILGQGLELEFASGKDGDILIGDTKTILGIFDPVFQESKGITNSLLTVATNTNATASNEFATPENVNKIRMDFRKNFGTDPAADLADTNEGFSETHFIYSAKSTSSDNEANNIQKINNYLEKISATVSQRDSLISILARNEEKQQELEDVESILSGEFSAESSATPEEQANSFFGRLVDDVEAGLDSAIDVMHKVNNVTKTISDILTGDATKGSLFDHLVEDDTRNLSGPGSGRRYIIHDHDIISCTFGEQSPDFNRVDVIGDAPFIGETLARQFEDRYYWAGATDFDSWRQYGYKSSGSKNLPFANDPETQCKPFAIMELQLQRVKINTGNITVPGNEYYEPGDVVYIPEKGLLYYVREVSHTLDIGSSFKTSLTLENGHAPGVYLPSPLDIIGQQYLKDPLDQSKTLVYRNQKGDDSYQVLQPDSALIFPPGRQITTSNVEDLLSYKDNQVRYTNMMINLSSLMIGERAVLLRGFVEIDSSPNVENVRNNLDVIKYLLQNPVQITQSNPVGLSDDSAEFVKNGLKSLGLTIGSSMGLQPMILPNGLIPTSISADKIVQQLVVLNKEKTATKIFCLNPDLLSAQSLDNKNIEESTYESVFPKGGPKQKTWLDLRDNIGQISNVVELGILDVTRALETSTASNKLLGE